MTGCPIWVIITAIPCGLNMKIISWFGTIASILGSFTVAMQFLLPGYCMFVCGSISWLIVGIKRADKALITLNGTFMLANIVGLYNALG